MSADPTQPARRTRAFGLALVTLALTSCAPEEVTLTDEPAHLDVTDVWELKLDARLPTDIQPTADGGFVVLDGYNGRALRFGADHAPAGTLGGTPDWGRPVRMAPSSAGGWWLADPGDDDDQGALVRVDDAGAVQQVVVPWLAEAGAAPWEPVAVREQGKWLVVADRTGRIGWLDTATGQVDHLVQKDVDDEKIGLVTDLVPLAGDALLAVDALGPKVHHLDASGKPTRFFGRWGLWAGSLFKPRSAAHVMDDVTLVADSYLGAVQAFDDAGRFLGEPARDGVALRFQHPLAVRAVGADTYVVLDAMAATVTGFRLPASVAIDALRADPTRALRVPLKEPDADSAAGHGGRMCLECHDGFVNDDREVWDPALGHHPVDMKPEGPVPAFFPLDEHGDIVCSTCHSPHGVVDLEAAMGTVDAEARLQLVRHQQVGEAFTRLTRGDSALCVACHGDAAHENVLQEMGLPGKGHPTGPALAQALVARGEAMGADGLPASLRTDCLGCHAPHGAVGEKLGRDPSEGRACTGCHEAQATYGKNHPLERRTGADVPEPRQGAKLQLARDGGLVCQTCHDLVAGQGDSLLRTPEDGGRICLACHDDRVDLMNGKHRNVKGASGLPCLGCHDPHGGDMDEHMLVTVVNASAGDPRGCLTCHGPKGQAAKAGVSPGTRGHPADGRKIEGKTEPLTCLACHDPHAADTPSEADCGKCHAAQAEADDRGGHGKVGCLDCHPAHQDPASARATSQTSNPAALRCLGCHGEQSKFADAPKVGDYTHPAPVFLPDGSRWTPLAGLPLYAPDGEQLPVGQNGDLLCGSCHLTHGPDAKKKGDSLRRPEWEQACSSCHGENALPLYRYFHQPERREGYGDTP